MELLGWIVIICGLVGTLGGVFVSFSNKKKEKAEQTFDAQSYVYSKFGEVINIVKPYYTSPGRHYHNWDHITEGLDFIIKNYKELLGIDHHAQSRGDRLILAWLFHDVVYNINDKDNEHKSGLLALNTLAFDSRYDCIGLDKLIEATADHKTFTPCRVTNLLCDIDLMRLGSDWDTFLLYSNQVYMEYKSLVPNYDDFMKARASFFNKMLAERESIYKTPFIRDKYEQSARSNIKRFITEYSS